MVMPNVKSYSFEVATRMKVPFLCRYATYHTCVPIPVFPFGDASTNTKHPVTRRARLQVALKGRKSMPSFLLMQLNQDKGRDKNVYLDRDTSSAALQSREGIS